MIRTNQKERNANVQLAHFPLEVFPHKGYNLPNKLIQENAF